MTLPLTHNTLNRHRRLALLRAIVEPVYLAEMAHQLPQPTAAQRAWIEFCDAIERVEQ